MVKLAKAAKKGKADQPPPKDDSSDEESSSEEDASSDEQESPPKKAKKERGVSKKNATPIKGAKNKKKLKTEEDEEEDEDSDSQEEMPTKKKILKAKQESEEDEEEMHPTPKKKKTPLKAKDSEQCFEEQLRKKKKAAAKAKQEAEEEEEPHTHKKKKKAAKVKESDGQGEEEVLSSKKKKKKAKLEALAKKKAQQDSDEDESEDEAMDTTPPVKKGKPAKEEESSEESSSSEEEESEQEITKEKLGKRKKGMPEKKPPPKKQKSGKDGFSLYVGNLKHTEDQDELVEALTQFFSTYGLSVTDVRLATTRKFGYVDFASEEELEKALELTGKELLGKEVKLDKALSKEATVENRKERDARTIFIKNLPFSVVEEDLQGVFEDAVEVRIPLNREGTSRGIAYIEFKTEADADKALEDNQGTDLKGRSMVIDFIGTKSQNMSKRKETYQSGKESKTLVINNLAYSATETSIQDIFEKASSIRIPQKNGRPKGFAFVDFETVEDAKEALETYNNTEIEGRTVRLEYSQSDKSVFKSGTTKTLFVKGLHSKTTEETLRDSFENAVCARVATDRESGASKGFGFVDFRTEEEAKAAKEAMEDGEIDGSKVTLDYAKPKGESQGGFRGGRGGRFRGGRGGGGRGGGRGGGGGRGFGGRGGGGGFGGGFRGRHDNTPRGKKIKFGD